MRTPDGSTMSREMEALQPQPVAVIKSEAARSGAVYVTAAPEVADKVPEPGGVHVAEPSENVSCVDSPTPSFVRARLEGMVATVCGVIFASLQGHCAVDPPAGAAAFPAVPGGPEPEDGPALCGALGPGEFGVCLGIRFRAD
jgi:hypothetical protein